MAAYDKLKLNQSRAVPGILQPKAAGKDGLQLQDNRPRSIIQKQQVSALANRSTSWAPVQQKANHTGLPDQLKSGIENLSGYSMNDVNVYYNSAKPAQLNAHAYAQGTDIHLAHGQEKHLPHEAWHVVQQKQGRVKPTLQMKGKVNINDDKGLEKEADVMGAKAASAVNKNTAQRFQIVTGPAAAPVQRKIMVNNRPYTPPGTADGAVRAAAADEYVRHYASVGEMNANLVSLSPTSFGLIESRALWYNIPYLTEEFFVFGEYHSGVTGSAIKAASHIAKPILNEALAGWNVSDAPAHGPVTTDKGLDENSSKLLRALEAWAPVVPGAPAAVGGAAPALPVIPAGEESTRQTENGSYRLVVKAVDGSSVLWRPQGAVAAPPSAYNTQDEAYQAIMGLFPVVFAQEIRQGSLDTFQAKLATAWEYFIDIYDKDARFFIQPSKQPVPIWLNIARNLRNALKDAAKKRVQENYAQWHAHAPNAAVFTAPDSGALNLDRADTYRNEFILAAVLRAKASNAYAFATMGNNHLEALKVRLAASGVPYITAPDFYGKYSKVAVSLASASLDTEITDFLNAVKAARVSPTEARIKNLLEKLDTKGYPGDNPLRAQLVTLLDWANVHGFEEISPPKAEPSEHERMAKELGFI